jgi:hypothetical protein
MIIVKLIGGLGNQMFQYAAGKQLSILHQTELLIDTSYLDKDSNGSYTKRELELNVFNLNLKFASDTDIELFNIQKSSKYSRGLQRNFPFLFNYVYAAESGSLFNKHFFKFPKNTYLEGFWQSENYFKNCKSILLNEFTPKEPINSINLEWVNKISNCESVFLHVRRGDYISNKNHNLHNILSMDYYSKALQTIKNNYPDIEVFVFSDDLTWCKENLNFEAKMHFMDANERTSFHLDLFVMSFCKHAIIANSSFSWWGAWLNNNPNKIVVAPKQWFLNSNSKDLIPNQWIKI